MRPSDRLGVTIGRLTDDDITALSDEDLHALISEAEDTIAGLRARLAKSSSAALHIAAYADTLHREDRIEYEQSLMEPAEQHRAEFKRSKTKQALERLRAEREYRALEPAAAMRFCAAARSVLDDQTWAEVSVAARQLRTP